MAYSYARRARRKEEPFGEYPDLAAAGTPITGSENYGGRLSFIGATNYDQKFHPSTKITGKLLWETTLPLQPATQRLLCTRPGEGSLSSWRPAVESHRMTAQPACMRRSRCQNSARRRRGALSSVFARTAARSPQERRACCFADSFAA